MPRLAIVGVMGSGGEEHRSLAEPLGLFLATLPVHLLTGGGAGVMSAVSRAFTSVTPPERRGLCLGVLPSTGESRQAYPNRWVEVPIRTHLPYSGERGEDPLSRNHINVLTSDVIVALPGNAGTRSEAHLALHYEKPIIAFLPEGTDIPGLSSEVPRNTDFEQVAEFVRTAIESLVRDR